MSEQVKCVWILFRYRKYECPIVSGVYTSVQDCNEAEVKLMSALNRIGDMFCYAERVYLNREPQTGV